MTDPIDTHSFNTAVNEILSAAIATSDERASQYSDSWALDAQISILTDHVLDIPHDPADKAWKRLLQVAVLCDIKLSRVRGGWKPDTTLDLVNYLAAFTRWREDHARLHEDDPVFDAETLDVPAFLRNR